MSLTTRATTDCIVVSVGDECGGLPSGKAEELSRSFTRGTAERIGLGLGLSIALNAVRVNSGDLYVRDIPGKGCVFSIDLPRQPPPSTAVPDPARSAEHGFPKVGSDEATQGDCSREPETRRSGQLSQRNGVVGSSSQRGGT